MWKDPSYGGEGSLLWRQPIRGGVTAEDIYGLVERLARALSSSWGVFRSSASIVENDIDMNESGFYCVAAERIYVEWWPRTIRRE